MEFNNFQKAALKRNAQNVYAYIVKEQKLLSQIWEMENELHEIQNIIESMDAPTKQITGGYGTSEIIKKVSKDVTTPSGNTYKYTKYEFIYPDTIIPPAEDKPNDLQEEESTTTTPDNYSEGIKEEIALNINL